MDLSGECEGSGAPCRSDDVVPTSGCCCPYYHEAIELVGRRWTGAILRVLMERPMRFSEVGQAVPELSDRLLSARMKELEARGLVQRTVHPGPPVRVEYSLSEDGSRAWTDARSVAGVGAALAPRAHRGLRHCPHAGRSQSAGWRATKLSSGRRTRRSSAANGATIPTSPFGSGVNARAWNAVRLSR